MNILCVAMSGTQYADRSHEVKLAEQLAMQGHNVHLLTEHEPAWPDDVSPPTGLSWQVEPVNRADVAREVAASVPAGGFDAAVATSISGAPILAHVQEMHPGVVTVCQILDVPLWRLEWGEQGPWARQWQPWLAAAMRMDRLVVNTERCRSDLETAVEWYGVDAGDVPPVDLVYYGIDTEAADAVDAVDPAPDREFSGYVGTVSRLQFYKGFDLGAMAVGMFPEPERPAYVVVGAGDDEARVVQTAQLAGAPVVMTGGVSDAEKFQMIKALDVALYPGFNPSIGSLFPLEAVYCGVPCVTWDLPIHEERFDRYHFAVPRFDVADMQATLETLLDGDQEVTVYDPESARMWIREERSAESHAEGLEGCLEAAAEGAPAVRDGPTRGRVTEEGLVVRDGGEE